MLVGFWGGKWAEIPGVADHKGHFFGCDGFGGDDEVAFVFAGGGVEDDDEVAVSWFAELVLLTFRRRMMVFFLEGTFKENGRQGDVLKASMASSMESNCDLVTPLTGIETTMFLSDRPIWGSSIWKLKETRKESKTIQGFPYTSKCFRCSKV